MPKFQKKLGTKDRKIDTLLKNQILNEEHDRQIENRVVSGVKEEFRTLMGEEKGNKIVQQLEDIVKECRKQAGADAESLTFMEVDKVRDLFQSVPQKDGKITQAHLIALHEDSGIKEVVKAAISGHKGDLSLSDVAVLYFNKEKREKGEASLERRLMRLEKAARTQHKVEAYAADHEVDDMLTKMFHIIDRDNSGTIESIELREVFPDGYSADLFVQNLLHTIDIDYDDKINMNEWITYCKENMKTNVGRASLTMLFKAQKELAARVEAASAKREILESGEEGFGDDAIVLGGVAILALIGVGVGLYFARRK